MRRAQALAVAVAAAIIVVAALAAGQAAAQATGLARIDAEASRIARDGRGLVVELALSQPVAWRVRTLDGPPRVVIDLGEADWRGVDPGALPGLPNARVSAVRAGLIEPGWSRLVVALARPLAIDRAGMDTSDAGPARLRVRLVPVSAEAFAARSAAAGAPAPEAHRPRPEADGALRVMLDPGHGGIDPGAEAGGLTEAALMLLFARELRDVLRRAGLSVEMTRDEDRFVPLEARIRAARAAGAGVLVSLHADALDAGEASGATVYTLASEASSEAARALAERHDRDEILSGVDLAGQDDTVSEVLIDLARTETAPRADRLADRLVAALAARLGELHKNPRQAGAFTVLKSPEIPSVLIELGFLSSAEDRARLADPHWRAAAQAAIRDGLLAWAAEDAATAPLRRR